MWIEILTNVLNASGIVVTSLAEVWIEICEPGSDRSALSWSLPLRKCGLKSGSGWGKSSETSSLPLRKCGLKYCGNARSVKEDLVTSLAEVWIEIWDTFDESPPYKVTSLAEVWIEIIMTASWKIQVLSHFPCGSVD